MEKTKVLFFIYQMGAGGAARTLLNIINNIDRTTFTPVLVTLNYNGSYEEYVHPDVKLIKLETKRLRSAVFPLAKVIKEEKVDIVFSTIPNYNTIAILGNLLSFTRAKNVVREAAYLGGDFSTNVKLVAYGLLYRRSSKVIALSKGVKENIVKRYKVNPANIQVIYNPVDVENIQQMIGTEKMTDEHQAIFSKDQKVIIAAGRLVSDKDHRTLIQAFAKVNSQMKSTLVILGEGELEDDLKEQAHELGIQDSVHFLGFQRNPYIYFKQADLFVLSSTREGFGHVLTEALAAGTPVLSTNCRPGAQEVLNHGEFGTLCEIGNASEMATKMMELLTMDEERRAAVIQKGRKRANDFHAKAIVKQYEEMFTQTLIQSNKEVDRG
nr:glycosyltransferase [Shouchella shacheensis]